VAQRVAAHRPDELAVAIITVEEQLSAWYTVRRRVKDRARLAQVYERFTQNIRFLAQVRILPFPENAIERYETLHRLKFGVRANDLRIAAIALDASAIVVTRNRRDFARVPDLQIEDWSA
jgi:tRNA(fMet)-specific endonuclease VapC